MAMENVHRDEMSLALEMGERDCEPLEARKGKEMDSSVESPERMQPCCYLDFSPVSLAICRKHLRHLKPLSLQYFVTTK